MASNSSKSKKTTKTTASEKTESKAISSPKKSPAPAEPVSVPAPVKAAKPAKKTPKAAPIKATEEKPATPKSPRSKATPAIISAELIAQRAYFIAEERMRSGKPGDPTQDWLDAENQLKAELKPKRTTKRVN